MFSDDFDITRTTDVLCVCGMCVWCGCVFVCVACVFVHVVLLVSRTGT